MDNLGLSLTIGTKGCCFICLRKVQPNESNEGSDDQHPSSASASSLSVLLQYLNMSAGQLGIFLKLTNGAMSSESSELDLGKLYLKVDLCTRCQKTNKEVGELVNEISVAVLKLSGCLDTIREQMTEAKRCPTRMKRYKSRMASDADKNGNFIKSVDQFRNCILTKCSEKVAQSKPQVVIDRANFEEDPFVLNGDDDDDEGQVGLIPVPPEMQDYPSAEEFIVQHQIVKTEEEGTPPLLAIIENTFSIETEMHDSPQPKKVFRRSLRNVNLTQSGSPATSKEDSSAIVGTETGEAEDNDSQCDICDKLLQNEPAYQNYLVEDYSGDMPYQLRCVRCKRSFPRDYKGKQEQSQSSMSTPKRKLNLERQVHLKRLQIKPRSAPAKTPKKTQSLRQSRKSNPDDGRKFQCHIPNCSKRFWRKEQLKSHVLIDHPHDKDNNGNPAPAKMKIPSNKNKPSAVEELEKNLRRKCPLCSKEFINKYTLKNHLNSVHFKMKFPCPVVGCRKSFCRKITLNQHMKHHAISKTVSPIKGTMNSS